LDGPFRGVPFLLKDLGGWLAGVRVTRGSRFFGDAPEAAADSEHVRRLKRAGLVIFGRTNSCELGLSLTREPALYGPTNNPWDTTRISGGSSGGFVLGIVGLKPTRSRNTMAPYAGEGLGGISTEHAVTLSVRDSAALLDATRGAGAGDPYVAPGPERPVLAEASADPGKLRITFTSAAPNGAPVEADSLRALAEAGEAVRRPRPSRRGSRPAD
jgi:Asp-tRNA(Asn)/Glu-tRNA(Gln) amidotransferase A subunit family amidase